jgi:hypothetical protein
VEVITGKGKGKRRKREAEIVRVYLPTVDIWWGNILYRVPGELLIQTYIRI